MESCKPARPVPLIHFHGTADKANPYEGGTSLAGLFVSVSDQMQFWVQFNGCPAQPQTTETGSIRHDLYTPCTAGADVELYTIVDGLHAWPGGEAVNQKMGEPTQENLGLGNHLGFLCLTSHAINTQVGASSRRIIKLRITSNSNLRDVDDRLCFLGPPNQTHQSQRYKQRAGTGQCESLGLLGRWKYICWGYGRRRQHRCIYAEWCRGDLGF